jgi:DNA-binding MarR family transcriptional regulator
MTQVEELYSSLVRTNLLMTETDSRFFQHYGLGSTRFYTLLHVHQTPGISLSDLSERLLCTKGNTTRIIKSLESDGLLARETDQEDNRALRLSLTEKGEKLFLEVMKAYQDFNIRRFECLKIMDQKAFMDHLDTLNQHLERILQTFLMKPD